MFVQVPRPRQGAYVVRLREHIQFVEVDQLVHVPPSDEVAFDHFHPVPPHDQTPLIRDAQ